MKILFNLNPYNQQRQTFKPASIYPVLLAMYATYLKNQGHRVIWDSPYGNYTNLLLGLPVNTTDKIITSESQIDVPFLELPAPDRVFTDAKNPKWQDNGNFKHRPGTYIMSSNSCWYKQCTFCVETKQPTCQTRPVISVMDEIGDCVKLGFKELFDDSGTFPNGLWLLAFCEQMILRGYNKKIRLGCNMRLDYLHPNLRGMRDMRKAGFRMILYGLESANQTTLDKINKGINIDSAVEYVKRSAKAGLEPHLAIMVGFPWESYQDALKTLRLVHYLLRKGYAKTAQASILTPFPDTPLYKEYPEINVDYDCKRLCRQIYNVGYHPEFWVRKIIAIRNMADLQYLWRSIKKGVGKC